MSFRRFLPLSVSQDTLRRIACTLGMATVLGACGYKGPLYMPPPPPAPQESLTTPPSGLVTPSADSAQTVPVPTTPPPESESAAQ